MLDFIRPLRERCRGVAITGSLRRWRVRAVGGWGLVAVTGLAGAGRKAHSCAACRLSSPVRLGPFEAGS
jgi:hypothetical protein